MAKATKALSGPATRKYLRDAVAAEQGLGPELARRLADRLDADISQIRVRSHGAIGAAVAVEQVDKPAPAPVKEPRPAKVAAPAPPSIAPPAAAEPASAPVAPAADADSAPFDPHAFSLVVVMTKQGSDGLLRRLETISQADHLKEIARAQHVTIDAALTDPAVLRAAIVAGTAERIAHRRAAAS